MKNNIGSHAPATRTAPSIAPRGGIFAMPLAAASPRQSAPCSDQGNHGMPLRTGSPQELLHLLLFVWEFCEGSNEVPEGRDRLRFFFLRTGGFHLLLMLLNAHYNKPQAGRRPGWQFCVLHDRIRISKRALRMLIQDAQAQGLVEQLPGVRDRRSRTYVLAPEVVDAWERLAGDLGRSLADVLASCSPNQLANADYRRWDPSKPATLQILHTAPYHQPHRP
jgi:DNA-binding MarR family transcriptional regulator